MTEREAGAKPRCWRAWPTRPPEGRSIVALAQEKYGVAAPGGAESAHVHRILRHDAAVAASTSDGRTLRKGAVDAVLQFAREAGRSRVPDRRRSAPPSTASPARAARRSAWPRAAALLGVIHLKDVVKPDIKERFAELRRMGIKTVMITGDNPVTAAAIASEAGVDDFIAEATPEDKLRYIRDEQAQGRLVAMCGDGTNDAPALAQADVGVAMQSGTQAAREAGNMVDLDSDPTKLIEVVEIGKQLLMTRGALTTFSIANDVAKYFAIIPAMFVATYPAARRAQRHGACHAAERNPVGGDLQRADHRGADPAGAEGRHVSAGRRRRAAAPQPAGLRPRRRRSCRSSASSSSTSSSPPCIWPEGGHAMIQHLRPALVLLVAASRCSPGSPIRWRSPASLRWCFPPQANGSLIEKDGKVVGSALIGQAFTRRTLFPAASVRDHGRRSARRYQDSGCALQRRNVGGLQSGADHAELARPRQRRR